MRSYREENLGLRSGNLVHRPATRNRWKTLKKGIYNPTNHKILGRTKKSWWHLSLFYSVFLVILFTMFAVCMWVLFSTLDYQKPKYILEESLIGTNPGLGFRPMSPDLKDGSLIWYSVNNKKSFEKFGKTLDTFFEPYANQTAKNFIDCDFETYPKGDEVCKVDMEKFGDCDKKISNSYGYDEGEPCVFIKLNNIFGWKPDCYHRPQPEMPHELNLTITKLNKPERLQVWVSCAGLLPSDRESIGSISHSPPGFPEYYFPYVNNKNYLSPLVAVKIHQPKPNVFINIECRAWAKNIEYHGGIVHRQGSVRFELLIDGPQYTNSTKVWKGIRNSYNGISSEEGLRDTKAPKGPKGIRHSHNAISGEEGQRNTEAPKGSEGVRHSHNAISGEEGLRNNEAPNISKGVHHSYNAISGEEDLRNTEAPKISKGVHHSYNAISGGEDLRNTEAPKGFKGIRHSHTAISSEEGLRDTEAPKGPKGVRHSHNAISREKGPSDADATRGGRILNNSRSEVLRRGYPSDSYALKGSKGERESYNAISREEVPRDADGTRGGRIVNNSGNAVPKEVNPTDTDATKGSRGRGISHITGLKEALTDTDATKGSRGIRKSQKSNLKGETSSYTDEMKVFRGKRVPYSTLSEGKGPTDTDAMRGTRGIRKSYDAISEEGVSSVTDRTPNGKLRGETSRFTDETKSYSGIRQSYDAFSREGPRDTDATKGPRGIRKSYNTDNTVSKEEGPKIPMQPKSVEEYVSYTVQYKKEM